MRADTARRVAIELIEKDVLVKQSKTLRDSIEILKEINNEQDSTIIMYERQKTLNSFKFEEYENQLQENIKLQERLGQQIKTNQAWAIGMGCTAAVSIASTIIVLILKK